MSDTEQGNMIVPQVAIQEGRGGTQTNPAVLNASWGAQYVGLVWPDITAAGEVASVTLTMRLIDGDQRHVDQQIAICRPPGENGVPSTWESVEADAFEGVYQPGEVVAIPLPVTPVMGEAGWGIVLHANVAGADNLQAVAESVQLAVVYGVPDPPEPPAEDYEYRIVRDFRPGDTMTLIVVDGDRTVAEMRWVK